MTIEKVCVRIPSERKDELLAIAKQWRATERGPGWDAKVIHQVARERFGGLLGMFEHHGWPERGSEMMRFVQGRVKETYGSVEAFEEEFRPECTR
jgi:hypothetical protein